MNFDGLKDRGEKDYLEFLLWHYRVVDAFWYIYIDEEQGSDAANHFNERVWEKAAALAAREIKKKFLGTAVGLDAFVQAQKLFPWFMIVDYKIEQTPDEVLISVPECPTQAARLKRGLGEYACKEMHGREFTAFAREIDPSIKTECIYAPLDPHPEEFFCKWRFTVEGE
jgi:hypothetical protein